MIMARSIHTTWRELILESKFRYSDNKPKEDRQKQMRDALYQKNSVKKQMRFERRQGGTLYSGIDFLDPSAIKIEIQDAGEFVHYPASKSDLIEVVKRMPPGVLTDINSIVFCLGKEYQEESTDEYDEEVRDPYTGRLSCDDNGLVYSSPVRGTYFPGTCKIFLYAYVYDKKEIDLEIIEPFLRLQMLSTFVHEAAHHDDKMRRTRRGRWIGINEYKCEDYAELKEMEWSQKVIIPYLLHRYPSEYDNLSKWIKEYGGVSFPLVTQAGESKGRQIDDKVNILFSASSPVEELFVNVFNGKAQRETMLEFAKALHFRDYYEECLEALESLIAKNPQDTEVMGIKADTFIHMEKYYEAELTAQECLSIEWDNTAAVEALCDVHQHRKDWKALMETSQRGIDTTRIIYEGTNRWEIRVFVEANIIAALHLREFNTAREAAGLLSVNGRQGLRNCAFLALITLLEGNSKSATEIAKSILGLDEVDAPVKAIMKWVYNKSVKELGECGQEYTLNKYEEAFLKNSDIIDLVIA
jgi:hypothetical protein